MSGEIRVWKLGMNRKCADLYVFDDFKMTFESVILLLGIESDNHNDETQITRE